MVDVLLRLEALGEVGWVEEPGASKIIVYYQISIHHMLHAQLSNAGLTFFISLELSVQDSTIETNDLEHILGLFRKEHHTAWHICPLYLLDFDMQTIRVDIQSQRLDHRPNQLQRTSIVESKSHPVEHFHFLADLDIDLDPDLIVVNRSSDSTEDNAWIIMPSPPVRSLQGKFGFRDHGRPVECIAKSPVKGRCYEEVNVAVIGLGRKLCRYYDVTEDAAEGSGYLLPKLEVTIRWHAGTVEMRECVAAHFGGILEYLRVLFWGV
jgi:hypothetical protein